MQGCIKKPVLKKQQLVKINFFSAKKRRGIHDICLHFILFEYMAYWKKEKITTQKPNKNENETFMKLCCYTVILLYATLDVTIFGNLFTHSLRHRNEQLCLLHISFVSLLHIS